MVVEIDQSGKLEQLNTGTALAYANGRNGAIWITAGVKREVVKTLRKSLIPSHDLWSILFAVLIYVMLIESLTHEATLIIDEEYTGKEKIIAETMEKLLVKKWGRKWKGNIRFKRIGKSSPAHKLSWEIHRSKNRQGIKSLSSTTIIKLLK